MTQVSVADFSIRDLIKPDPSRVKKILSAILNFAKFREEQLSVFDKHTIRSVRSPIPQTSKWRSFRVLWQTTNGQEQYETQHRELIDHVEANRARLAAVRVQRAEEAPLIAERKEINEQLRNDLKNLKRQQSALTNDIDTLKREKNVLTEKLVPIQPSILVQS
jgi:kinetochore protein Nuf2